MVINKTISIKYTVNTDNGLAIFFINLGLFAFKYAFSTLLQGIYNKYAIKIPIKNGIRTPKRFLNQFPIAVKLSKVLYTKITATANKNQYIHFVIVRFLSSISTSSMSALQC